MSKRLRIPISYRSKLVGERGYKCERCKKYMFKHIHHINTDPSDNRPENLKLLCEECHIVTHIQLYKERGKRFSKYLDPDKGEFFDIIRKYKHRKTSHERYYKNDKVKTTMLEIEPISLYYEDVEYKP